MLESMKEAKEARYADKANVITFCEFFDEKIAHKRPQLRLPAA